MRFRMILFILGLLVSCQIVEAGICTSTKTGNWNNSSTWSCGRIPASNDTIIVSNLHVVTVNCNCGVYNNMRLEIYGELYFNNGQKLSFDINSVVQIYLGGSITGGNPGSKIIIDGDTKWDGGDQDIIGPAYINSATPSPTGGVLPIDLLSFNAELVESEALINWVTAAEINNDYFIVDKSDNLLEWEEVAVERGAGNSVSMLSYSAIDHFPLYGISYYRLSQVDYNGKINRFDPIAFKVSKKVHDIVIWPNPAKEYFVIELPQNIAFNIEVRNSLGQLCKVLYEKRKDELIYDSSILTGGLYIIKFQIDNELYSRKVLIN